LWGQLCTAETAGVLEACFTNPVTYWEGLENPEVRDGTEKPSSWFIYTGLESQQGWVLMSKASHLEIIRTFLRRAEEGQALACSEITCD